MNWMAALIGSIIHDWDLDQVLLKDGSSHGLTKTYHYSWEKNGKPSSYNSDAFRKYLESCLPIHDYPTIHFEGIATRSHAEQWNEILDDLGNQDDILIVPTLAANLQEAIYCMLNIVTKDVIEDKKYLQIVTGIEVIDDETMFEACKSLLANWSLMSGASIARKPKQFFYMKDIINNDASTILIDNLSRIFDKNIDDRHVSSIMAAHRRMLKLNNLNWQLSQRLVRDGPDIKIFNLKQDSLILKTLDAALRL